jgi:uncharacterized protein YjbI with pentapeptide repeats
MKHIKLQGVFLITLGTAILVSLMLSLTASSVYSAQQTTDPQLETKDVLVIVARPLPENATYGYYLPNVDLHNTKLIGVNFAKAELSYSNLSGSFLLNADFSNSSLQQVNFLGAELSNSQLANAWLLEANLENATIAYAKLDGANFEDAILTNADLTSSSLVNVNLKGATITGASFSGAIMTGVVLPNGQTYQKGDDLITQFGTRTNP